MTLYRATHMCAVHLISLPVPSPHPREWQHALQYASISAGKKRHSWGGCHVLYTQLIQYSVLWQKATDLCELE